MSKSSFWVPDEREGGAEDATFYSELDLWDYGVLNFNTCVACFGFGDSVYSGPELLTLFPDHVILDEDTIWPRVHPNCTCVMRRIAQGREEQVVDISGLDIPVEMDVEMNAPVDYGFSFGGLDEFGGYW